WWSVLNGRWGRKYQHRVAVTEEAITLGNRRAIGIHDSVAAGKGADQHDQRRFRQMEIGQQDIDAAKAITGINKNARVALKGRDLATGARRFERAHSGGADGENATTARTRRLHLRADGRIDLDIFGVHVVVANIVDPHR